MDYLPETITNPAWSGIAEPESAPQCRMHDRLPEKVVAYERMNTGRRFYTCSKRNVSSTLLFII
jgi:hypothetical protein